MIRTVLKTVAVLIFMSTGTIAFAQQNAPAPDSKMPAAAAAPAIQSAPSAAAAPAGNGTSTTEAAKPSKATLHELSPLSMFLSADIIVKAVMIGLAFASLVTWTIFIAKMAELTLVQRGLRAALGKIAEFKVAGGGAICAGLQRHHPVLVAGGGDARGAAVGGNFQ